MEKYKQLKVLGKGSFGAAWLIQRKSDNEQLVAKEVRLAGLKPAEKESAKNEIMMLRTLKHPNITKYVDHFEHHGSLYIVMEYADGGDMYMKIKDRHGRLFSEQEVLHYFCQLCLALNYLHENRVLHRDLKTQNVFLTRDRIVKLGDFGISTVLRNTCELKRTVCGTPYYFSPELCLNKPYNNKSDVWALGCVLYEVATLSHAFDGTNMKALVQKILKGVYPPIHPTYSPELSTIISTALDVNPSRRPNVSQILQLPFLQGALRRLQAQLHVAQQQRIAVLPAIEPCRAAAKWPAQESPGPARQAEPHAPARQAEPHATPPPPPSPPRDPDERKRQLLEKQRELQSAQEQLLLERRQQLEDRVRAQRRLQEQRAKAHGAKLQQLEERWVRDPPARAGADETEREKAAAPARGGPSDAKGLYLEARRQALLNKQRVQALEHGYPTPAQAFHRRPSSGLPPRPDPAVKSSRPPSPRERLEDARAAAFWQMRREAEQNRRRMLGLDVDSLQQPNTPYSNNNGNGDVSSRRRSEAVSPSGGRGRRGGAGDWDRPLPPGQAGVLERKDKVHSSPSGGSPRRDRVRSPPSVGSPRRNKGYLSPNVVSPRKDRAYQSPNVASARKAPSPPTPPWLASPDQTYRASSLVKAPSCESGENLRFLINDENADADEDRAQREKHRNEDYGALDTVIADALTVNTKRPPPVMQDFDDDDTTTSGGDGENQRDLMRFMLEGKTLRLPHVRESDPLMCRIEALRVYLEDNLGERTLLACYNAMNHVGDDDNAMQRILEVLPQQKQRYVPLVAQLIVCEDVFNRQGEVPRR